MNISHPNNEAEAAYLGFAISDALTDVLVKKGILAESDVGDIARLVAVRLSQGGSFESQRAAKFLSDWIRSKPPHLARVAHCD
jgi:hypothetical protein